jgi:hypothetical protein
MGVLLSHKVTVQYIVHLKIEDADVSAHRNDKYFYLLCVNSKNKVNYFRTKRDFKSHFLFSDVRKHQRSTTFGKQHCKHNFISNHNTLISLELLELFLAKCYHITKFFILWQNTWEKQFKGRNYLFWFTVSEISVPPVRKGVVEQNRSHHRKRGCPHSAFSFFPFYSIWVPSLWNGTTI